MLSTIEPVAGQPLAQNMPLLVTATSVTVDFSPHIGHGDVLMGYSTLLDGLVTDWTYDDLNRVTAMTFPSSPSENVAWTYDDPVAGHAGDAWSGLPAGHAHCRAALPAPCPATRLGRSSRIARPHWRG